MVRDTGLETDKKNDKAQRAERLAQSAGIQRTEDVNVVGRSFGAPANKDGLGFAYSDITL